jgi:hypothetical protein
MFKRHKKHVYYHEQLCNIRLFTTGGISSQKKGETREKMDKKIVSEKSVFKIILEEYKNIKNGTITLLEVPAKKHMKINTETLKLFINKLGYQCIYITLGKGCYELDTSFNKAGITANTLQFIDAISQMYGISGIQNKRYHYVAGPLDIDGITACIQEILPRLPGQKKCVFLDSVTTVLLYNALPRTIRFSKFLTQELKKTGVTSIMVSVVKGLTTQKLRDELAKLSDKVLVVQES